MRLSFNEPGEVDFPGAKPSLLPEPDRVGRLWAIGPWHLIGEVGGDVFVHRAVEDPEHESPEGDGCIPCAVLQEGLPEGADLNEGRGVVAPVPELSFRGNRRGSGEEIATEVDDFSRRCIDEFCGGDCGRHRACIDSHRGEASEPCGKICRPPAAEGVKHPIPGFCFLKAGVGEVEGEHGVIGRDGVQPYEGVAAAQGVLQLFAGHGLWEFSLAHLVGDLHLLPPLGVDRFFDGAADIYSDMGRAGWLRRGGFTRVCIVFSSIPSSFSQ